MYALRTFCYNCLFNIIYSYILYLNSSLSRALTPSILTTKCLYPGGIGPYMGYIGMCGSKGYGFSATLVMYK